MTLIGSFSIRKQFDFNLFFDYEHLDAKIKTIFKDQSKCLQSIETFKKQGFKEEGLYFMERYVNIVGTIINDYERCGLALDYEK